VLTLKKNPLKEGCIAALRKGVQPQDYSAVSTAFQDACGRTDRNPFVSESSEYQREDRSSIAINAKFEEEYDYYMTNGILNNKSARQNKNYCRSFWIRLSNA
jgi:hypothetical protein